MAKVKKKTAPKKTVASAKKVIKKASNKREKSRIESAKLASKEEVELALEGRRKLVLQKRNEDTIVYVRMKPDMFDVFEEAYAKYCTENLLNPKSYGMSSFVRENAFSNLKAKLKL